MTDFTATVYETIDRVDANQWNNLVEQSSLGSFFQRTEWLRTVEEALDREARHVVVSYDGNPVGVCPNVATTARLPEGTPELVRDRVIEYASITPGYGGPVIQGNEEDVLESIIEAIDDASGPNVISHYLKTIDLGYARFGKQLEANGYKPYLTNCRFVIDLDRSIEEIVDRMGKDRRYDLRKAKENDFDVHTLDPIGDPLWEFYTDYRATMDRVGSTPLPFSFFESLAERAPERVLLGEADVDGETVGRHFYVLDDEQGTIHHLFSGVREENFEYYPSELIHEFALEWGTENGYRSYDFGETGADTTDGLFKYKEQYGGDVVPTLTWERGDSPLWPIYDRARRWYFKRGK